MVTQNQIEGGGSDPTPTTRHPAQVTLFFTGRFGRGTSPGRSETRTALQHAGLA
jgi:hypothetical protein